MVPMTLSDQAVNAIDAQLRAQLGLLDPIANARGVPVAVGLFTRSGMEGQTWGFQPTKTDGSSSPAFPLARLSVQSLEQLQKALTSFAYSRLNNQQANTAKPEDAMTAMNDIVVARDLLGEVMRLLGKKNDELVRERMTRERELREALGPYAVANIGHEQVNAVVASLFGKRGVEVTVREQE
jgi:hypothetical protein